jgi:hypothetical protein
MKQHMGDDTELRRYLLGELTREEQVTVEARLFLDGDYLSQLKAVEDELVDEYAYDELPAGEREKFETNFFTLPEHRVDLEIALALKRFISSQGMALDHAYTLPTTASAADIDASQRPVEGRFAPLASLFRRRPIIGFSLAAIALVALSFITWLVIKSWRGQHTDHPIQAHQPTPPSTEPAERREPDRVSNPPVNNENHNGGRETAEGQRDGRRSTERTGRPDETQVGPRAGRDRATPPPVRQTEPQVATFLLLPGGAVRGDGRARSVAFSSDVRSVILKLPLADVDDYRSYRATLRNGERPNIWANLKPEVDAEFGRVVSVQAPASLFRQQSYRIELSGVVDNGQIRKLRSYTFRVERK